MSKYSVFMKINNTLDYQSHHQSGMVQGSAAAAAVRRYGLEGIDGDVSVLYVVWQDTPPLVILPREVIESAKIKCCAVTQTHARVITHYEGTMLHMSWS